MTNKKLQDLSQEEWEGICRRCGKCCLIKLEDEDTGQICYTNVVCRYFDEEKCACSIYDKRCEIVPECLKLNKENVQNISWMPQSCAYRCLFENRPLPKVSSIKGRCISEAMVNEQDIEDYIVDWDDL